MSREFAPDPWPRRGERGRRPDEVFRTVGFSEESQKFGEKPTRDVRKIGDCVSPDRKAKSSAGITFGTSPVWSCCSVTLRLMTWMLGLGRILSANSSRAPANRGFAFPARLILPSFRPNDPPGNSPTVSNATHGPTATRPRSSGSRCGGRSGPDASAAGCSTTSTTWPTSRSPTDHAHRPTQPGAGPAARVAGVVPALPRLDARPDRRAAQRHAAGRRASARSTSRPPIACAGRWACP